MKFSDIKKTIKGVAKEYAMIRSTHHESYSRYHDLMDAIEYHKYNSKVESLDSTLKLGTRFESKGIETLLDYESDGLRVLLLHDGQPTKYVHAIDELQKEYIVSIPFMSMHRYAIEHIQEATGKKTKCLGGGWLEVKDGTIQLYGKSQDFGRADHDKIADTIKKIRSDKKVTTQ